MGTSDFNAVCNPAMDEHPIQGGGWGGGVEILLVALCYRNHDKLWPGGPLGCMQTFTYPVPREGYWQFQEIAGFENPFYIDEDKLKLILNF